MRRATLAGVTAALIAAWSAPAAAADVDADGAIRTYCEPVVAGAPAAQVADAARKAGFQDVVVMGQPMLRLGEVLVGVSDTPRACLVQAPLAMTLEQGFALADAWGARRPGAVKSATTKGPDGAPVRAWSAPSQKMSLIATQQHDGTGRKVMNFILMPIPAQSVGR